MSNGSCLQTGLEPILAHIVVGQSRSSAAKPPPSCEAIATTMPPRALSQVDSGASSVRFCGFACRCPECCKMEEVSSSGGEAMVDATSNPPVALEEANDAGSDSCSAEAFENLTSVPAARGAVARLLKRPSSSSIVDREAPKVKIVTRANPPEQYIMLNGKWLVGCSAKACASYQAVIEELTEVVKEGTVATKPQAKEWLKRAIAEHT